MTRSGDQPKVRLLLDEMFSPKIAEALRERGHDVLAVAERQELRTKTDPEIAAWAVAQERWLLTENVRDFRPLLLSAGQTGAAVPGMLFTSSRSFPRSRANPGPLIEALDNWLKAGTPSGPFREEWLRAD
jgi:Domain of unknown function (DUF5615)